MLPSRDYCGKCAEIFDFGGGIGFDGGIAE
jgi:hypothetical protein